jgi:cytoskeletal protein RodZ
MEILGGFLQQMRQERGMTLEQVASRTKISLRMLRALEADDYSQIPSRVAARGFVRSYARFLGIDEDSVLQKFRELTAPFYMQQSPAAAPDLPSPSAVRSKGWPWPLVSAVMGGFVLLIGVVLYKQLTSSPVLSVRQPELGPATAIRQDDSLPVSDEAEKDRIDPQQKRAIKPLTFPIELTVNVPAVSPAQASVPPVLSPPVSSTMDPESLTLGVEAIERSWVMVHIDDQMVKEVILQPGEKVRWQAKTKFLLTLGNAGGVKLQFNGKTLDSLGPTGKVVKNIVLQR